MNNYDGPAYYRWRRDLKTVQRTKKQNKQPQRETSSQPASRGSQSLAAAVAPIKHNKGNQDRTEAESKFSKQIRKFEPKKRPAIEEPNAQMVHFFDRQSNQRAQFYDRLVKNLRLKPNELILFGDPNDYDEAEMTANIDDSNSQVTGQSSSNTSSEVTKTNEPTEPVENENETTESNDIDDNNEVITDSSHSVEQVGDSETDDISADVPETSETEDTTTGGLGKSFSSIMGGEANDTKLPFFEEDDLQSGDETLVEDVAELPVSSGDDIVQKTPDVYRDRQINQRFQNPVSNSVDESNNSDTGTEEITIEDDSKVSLPVSTKKNEKEIVTSGEDENNFNVAEYKFPSMDLLTPPVDTDDDQILDWIENQIDVLDKTLAAFGVDAKVVDWTNGPTVTQFQIKLALGVKVQRIVNLRDDLKLALAAKDVRIEAPIPGKSTVGIEIPNKNPRPVMLSEIIDTPKFAEKDSPLTTAVGVDISGRPQVTDIRKMPHGLIAGATGSGKSVFINSLLVSILYKANPAEVKLLLIDPKAVELAPYDEIPHLLSPVISDPQEAAAALKWVTKEMDERYEKLSAAGVRNIEQFNQKAEEREEYGLKMPYILVIIDELADLMMVASSEIQDYIVRITQKARAAGIHLIVATQRPSVDIVTGTIKNNIPTRIAFMVSSQVDSRTIIDTGGAESLLGKGDMLYLGNGAPQPVRLQGAYVTNEELENVVDFVKQQGKPKYLFTPDSLKQVVESHNEDELMPEVLKYISNEDTISTSKLQRLFSIGYNRAANIIDALERHHYISEQHGSKPREVYYREDTN